MDMQDKDLSLEYLSDLIHHIAKCYQVYYKNIKAGKNANYLADYINSTYVGEIVPMIDSLSTNDKVLLLEIINANQDSNSSKKKTHANQDSNSSKMETHALNSIIKYIKNSTYEKKKIV